MEDEEEKTIEEYSKYYEANNGSPTDPNTYLVNMIGYYYSYGKKNVNLKLYNKSLELIKKSKTFSDIIKLFYELDKVLSSINDKSFKEITEQLESLETQKDRDLFSKPIENRKFASVNAYGGNPYGDMNNKMLEERIDEIVKVFSPSKSNSHLNIHMTDIITSFNDTNGGPCSVEQTLDRLNRTPKSNTGHWINGDKIKLDSSRPLPDNFPSIATHMCAYLWTLNKCSSGSSIYDYATNSIRTNNINDIQKLSLFLTELYMAIISYKNYDKDIEKTVNFAGERVNIHKKIPNLYRGENAVYNPELLGLSNLSPGSIKWTDIAIKRGDEYVLNKNCSVNNISVFQAITATSPSKKLAGYFCSSSQVPNDSIRVMYEFENLSQAYAGWLLEVQYFREKENLVLPGLVIKSKNIEYYHYKESKRYWDTLKAGAGGTVSNGNIVPLLVIQVEVIGITGHLPGLHPSVEISTMQYLNPYLKLMNKDTAKTLQGNIPGSPGTPGSPGSPGSPGNPGTPLLENIYWWAENTMGKIPAEVTQLIPPAAIVCVCKAMPIFGFDLSDVFKYTAIATATYQTTKYVKNKLHHTYLGGDINNFKKLEEISNRLLLSIEKIGNIIVNFSSTSKGKSKRTKGKSKRTKGKRGKTKGKRGKTKGKKSKTRRK